MCTGQVPGLVHEDCGSLESSTDDSSEHTLHSFSCQSREYVDIDGTPGLRIGTHCTRSWTPITARTRLKSKNKSHPIVKLQIFRLHASSSSISNLAIQEE